ncbi:lysophospholipase [Zooshikella sp. RANM57]|uniref:alpha/beta hydrolase n=1 Tax=Zooshikella sp. RANM57 TaxID=3425863 RepID=UPI003D6FAA16
METRFASQAQSDQTLLHGYQWQPVKASTQLLIVHGMTEHSQRYQPFAQFLNQQGIGVTSWDLRAHGQTGKATQSLGQAETNQWSLMLRDIQQFIAEVSAKYPEQPLFLMGHSMGSFLCLHFLQTYHPPLAGCILSGSNYQSPWLYQIAKAFAALECKRQGQNACSAFLDFLFFGRFNRHFKPNRTEFDWLSRDTRQVDLYCQDPLCGFKVSNQFWYNMLSALTKLSTHEGFNNLPTSLPVYILGGDHDPLSLPNGLHKLKRQLRFAGVHDVTAAIYPGGRHEMLNEINQQEVWQALYQWLAQHTQPLANVA